MDDEISHDLEAIWSLGLVWIFELLYEWRN